MGRGSLMMLIPERIITQPNSSSLLCLSSLPAHFSSFFWFYRLQIHCFRFPLIALVSFVSSSGFQWKALIYLLLAHHQMTDTFSSSLVYNIYGNSWSCWKAAIVFRVSTMLWIRTQFITVVPLFCFDCVSPVVIIFEEYFICLIRHTEELGVWVVG